MSSENDAYIADRMREGLFKKEIHRIVSLVPSDTYSLACLGVSERLVGKTDYCEMPSSLASVPRVGGTKNANLEAILDLKPDLVIANQEENSKSLIASLYRNHIPVFLSFPKRVPEGIAHLARLAKLLRVEKNKEVKELIRQGYQLTQESSLKEGKPCLSVFCPIWRDPWMSINEHTYVHDALSFCGLKNSFEKRMRRYPLHSDLSEKEVREDTPSASTFSGEKEKDTRYPRVSKAEILRLKPGVILLPDEPYAFSESDIEELLTWDIPAASSRHIFKVNGKHLSWHGAWAIHGLPELKSFLAGKLIS